MCRQGHKHIVTDTGKASRQVAVSLKHQLQSVVATIQLPQLPVSAVAHLMGCNHQEGQNRSVKPLLGLALVTASAGAPPTVRGGNHTVATVTSHCCSTPDRLQPPGGPKQVSKTTARPCSCHRVCWSSTHSPWRQPYSCHSN